MGRREGVEEEDEESRCASSREMYVSGSCRDFRARSRSLYMIKEYHVDERE